MNHQLLQLVKETFIGVDFADNCVLRWFNVDCSQAEGLYSLNDEIAAEAPQGSGGGAPGPGPAGGCFIVIQ